MENIIDKLKKFAIPTIFIIFFCIVAIQHKYLYLYHDDYGYASLTYSYVVEDATGHNNNLDNILQFLKGHYNSWGGRILYFTIECIILNISLDLFRVIQALFITLIMFFIYKIVSYKLKKFDIQIAILTCACYGFIQLATFKSGIFWISASVLYIFPLLFIFAFLYYYITRNDRNFKNKVFNFLYKIMLCIFIFCASFSQEQLAVVIVGYIVLQTIYDIIKNKKINVENIFYCIFALIGFAILMLAPGNSARMESDPFYEKNIFERVLIAFPGVLINIYGNHDKLIIAIVLITSLYSAYKLLESGYLKFKLTKVIIVTSFISTFFMLVITLMLEDGYYFNFSKLTHDKFSLLAKDIIFSIQTVLWLIPIIIKLIKKEQIELCLLTLTALASQLVMLNSGYYPLRSMLPFNFCFFIIFVYMLIESFNETNRRLLWLVIISILSISIINTFYITYGYRINSGVNYENDKILTEVSNQIKNGEIIKSVELKKTLNENFAGELPYQPNYKYIENFMKYYYELPKNIIFNYK